MRWNLRSRISVVCVLGGILFSAVTARLVQLQVLEHERYVELAARQNSVRQVLPAKRGRILDSKGDVLATDFPTRTVVVDGTHIKDPAALAKLAAPFLEMPESELAKKFSSVVDAGDKYQVVRHGLAEEKALGLVAEMDAKKMRGIYFEKSSKRIYPNGALLGHVLGFLNHESKGIQGVEMSMNDYLKGQNGFRQIERDRTGREIVVYRGLESNVKNGSDVELTIDMALQAILEEELEKAYQEMRPRSISGVLVRPGTGEVLAMANRPNFDPNDPGAYDAESMKNRVIIDMVEPGSVFKIVAVSAALNEKKVKPETPIFCENGSYHYGGRILKDSHPYGTLSVHDVIVKSSNIGSSKMAQMVGNQTYYEYIRKFGFGERTGIELPGEIPGLVHPPHRWTKISITRIPMGHEVAVTPLQVAMATSAVANGGKLMVPQIVRRIVSEDGEEVFRFKPQVLREVVPPQVAEKVRLALKDVVGPTGTARQAAVQGFTVGGKTGTAQRVDPKGGYTPGKYVVSFCGFLPAESPEFTGYIIVDDATTLQTRNYGGLVAAPIFSRVAERAARYLDLQPTVQDSILATAAPVAPKAKAIRQ